ncbi:ABC transporter permease [Larkinella soli]|uniref:ABC transporter permease n=1 Tax=Larkinella soli TaxID=1770527 RepID=UPI000FFB5C7F|nr:ABC transporter permease [Larkinella soli]
MFRNYLKIAWRNFRNQPFFSLINLLGLSVGMAACMVIGLYVTFEKSYDDFHPDAERIYRIELDNYQDGKLAWRSATSYPAIVPTMKKDYPEVEDYCRLYDANSGVVSFGDRFFRETNYFFADSNALTFFQIGLLKGDPKTALVGTKKVVLSESTARKYFGGQDPLNRMVKLDTSSYLVTGVFKDYPKNSHLEIDLLFSYRTEPQARTSWGWYDFFSYVKLRPGADPQKLEARLPDMFMKYNGDWYRRSGNRAIALLQPLRSIHLESHLNQEAEVNGNGRTVQFLVWVAFAILIIAWINYINLSTSRALDRAKEVGVRKVVGAMRASLIRQFIFESLLLNLLALAVGVGLVAGLLPVFNELTGKPLTFGQLFENQLWVNGMLVFFFGTLLSSLYPAFVLSDYEPIAVLKGRFAQTARGVLLRQGLIVVQFAASVMLIIGTLTVYKQLRFMQEQSLGFDKEQTLVVRAPRVIDASFRTRSETFRQTLQRENLATGVTGSAYVPGTEILWTSSFRRKDRTDGGTNTMFITAIDHDFLDNYKIGLVAGRNFDRTFGTDSTAVLLNETAVKTFGFRSPAEALNREIISGDTAHVIGVVKDFHQQGLKLAKDPMIFISLYRNARSFEDLHYYSLKVKTANLPGTIEAVGREFERAFSGNPFEYFFLDAYFNEQYRSEQQFGQVFGLFAGLAIFIASLGLLGLISFTVARRTREIGIRKVLGADVSTIVFLLTKDFLGLVLVAIVLAAPLAAWLMNDWLSEFAYRTSIGLGIFVAAGLLSLLIALLTISFQSIKAALMNPVKSLRSE